LPEKKWGVYSHRIAQMDHPLLRDINTRFDVPHSRHNDVSRAQMEAAGMKILAESEKSGVHLAVSPDQFRVVYFQGHPEYDQNSLLKEYKREVGRFVAGDREDYPPHLENYFSPAAVEIVDAYEAIVRNCLKQKSTVPPFPEEQITLFGQHVVGHREIDCQQLAGHGVSFDQQRPKNIVRRRRRSKQSIRNKNRKPGLKK